MEYVLLLTLVLQLQDVGTEVKVVTREIPGFMRMEYCREARDAWLRAHETVATEPRSNYEAPEDEPDLVQPLKDRFKLLTPVAVCAQLR